MSYAAVCCSGPSLTKTWQGADDNCRIFAVNGASSYVKGYHYFVAGDAVALDMFGPTPLVSLVCPKDVLANRKLNGISWELVMNAWAPIRRIECNFSAIVAICAASMFTRHIKVYGADMDGDRYYNGIETGTHLDRWVKERKHFADCVDRLARFGTTVERVIP